MTRHNHICGLYYVVPKPPMGPTRPEPARQYLPQLSLSARTKIVSSTSRTTLTQTFVNPKSEAIPELRYTFPLYEGVSVVGFVCTINDDRVIRGVVKERAEARTTYKEAIDRGETAGLLEQLPDASDVFTTTIGNVPAGATLKVDITYLGELKHDAEVDGMRFTIPTHIAPRYGSYPGQLLSSSSVNSKGGINVVVDVEMPDGSSINKVQSPSHPISVTIGNTSTGSANGAEMSLQKASATLALETAELGDDFVLQVVAGNTGNPVAVLETHPTIPNHRALMATLVPKFSLPSSRPEIVFLCDRSGSMGGGNKIPNLKAALHVFLKSLPLGIKFNICSFGSRHEFLFPGGSRTYEAAALEEAARYVDQFAPNFGGTEIYYAMEEAIKRRYADMDLEVFLLTDGEIWNQGALFDMLNRRIAESNGAIRVFTFGIGRDVSHALIEGVARAGNGFSQTVGDNENMNSKAVRMLKAALTPHVKDYTLEVAYRKDGEAASDDGFEIVEKVMDALTIDMRGAEEEKDKPTGKKPFSLFDESANPDADMTDSSLDTSAGGKYSHVPPVSPPKLLQAPFIIPPLFPFSRTSVYLLLGPDTVQKQPKSITLRGTSPYGPLELEIPVTVLSERGETIHQLAARKAVQELEEGRGWIYHAKDAKDGALLKDKHPGRFPDMVEREAVRLGVTYQVGGKWCSFVAIDENKASGVVEERANPASESSAGEGLRSPVGITMARVVDMGSARSSAVRDRGRDRDRDRDPSGADQFLGLLAASAHAKPRFMQARQESAPPPPMPSAAALPRPVNFSSRSPNESVQGPVISKAAYPHSIPTRGSALGSTPKNLEGSKSPVARSMDSGFGPDDSAGFGGWLAPAGKLDSIVALQSFTGAWRWSDELLQLLELDKEQTTARATSLQLGGASDVLATALVLAYLELKLADQRDEWEMLADKARGWLQDELRREGLFNFTVEKFLDEAKKLIMMS
ncbi:hypothetical protein VTK56DRAFT_9398 [Thermocarpiscus australiensis]